MPLSEMYRTMLEANNPATWEKNRQSELMGQMLLQEKQQQLDEASRLRELFSRGGMPSEEAMFAASPATAMKYRESQNKQMKDFIEMQKAQQDIASSQFKLNAEQETLLGQAHGAVVDAFDQLIAQGIPKDKAIQIVTPYAGQLTSHLATLGVRTGQSFDPKNINEDSIENMRLSARRSKYPLMSDKTLQEAQLRNLPPAWTAEQYRGTPPKVERNPVTQQPEMMPGSPGLRGGMPQGSVAGAIFDQSTGESIAPTAENLPKIQKLYNEVSDPNERQILGSVINSIKMSGGGVPPAGTTNVPEFRGQVAKAEKEATLSAEEEIADRKAVDSYLRSKPPEQVRNLIKESLAGDLETGLARLGKLVGVTTPGGAPTAALKVITQQLASTSPFAPGSQSDVEYKARLQKIGDPASDEPIENRLAALDEFYRDQESFVTQKWNPKSETEILDARKKGYISEDNALEVFRRFKKSKSGAM